MYVTTNAAVLQALEADTGELLWSFDSEPPEDVDDFTGTNVNRGAALYQDRVIWNNLVEDLIADVKNHNGGGMVFAFVLP
jgi:glucose dehydrogenase